MRRYTLVMLLLGILAVLADLPQASAQGQSAITIEVRPAMMAPIVLASGSPSW